MNKNGMYKHGLWNTKFYRAWYNILGRCNRQTNRSKNYRDRGIKCERKTFEEFRDDMYKSYLEHVEKYGEKNTSINRIDNNGNYCKDNCERATTTTQSLNTSRNLILEKDGVKKTAKERSKELGINENTIRVRYLRGKDPLYIGKIYKKGSIALDRKKHCEIYGEDAVKYINFYQRVKIHGWDIQKAINTPNIR